MRKFSFLLLAGLEILETRCFPLPTGTVTPQATSPMT